MDGTSKPRQAVRLLRDVAKDKQVSLSFVNLSVIVPVLVDAGPQDGAPQGAEKPKEREVLHSVSGVCEPGCLFALMGPSGSGKSSLLSVLGGRSTARTTGDILFNGQPMTKAIKRSLGFVTQDDLLFAELTTFETLYFAAMLRLPRSWTLEAKLQRVDMVLEGLGLQKCRDTIIGNAMMRGVSGGERKRVSISCELLINPSVLFLDEPTSGLDSTTALKLVHTLRNLAFGGRTIVASIHQPSSRLYQEFDQLMLLADGNSIFYGEANQASAAWFAMLGVPVPFGVSTPDHLLDLACADLPDRSAEESLTLSSMLLEGFNNRKLGLGKHGLQPSDFGAASGGAFEKEGPSTTSGSVASTSQTDLHILADNDTKKHSYELQVVTGVPSTSIALDSRAGKDDSLQEANEPSEDGHKWGATWWQQVRILTSRCVRVRRFAALSIQRFAEVVIVALLAGLFWFQAGGTKQLRSSTISDLAGLLFFQILFMSFSSMFQAIFTFPADFQMLVKERQSGMYRLSAYYVARSMSDIPMDCLVPTLFSVIIYFMSGLRLSPGAFFSNWTGMLLTMLTAQSAGLLIGATVMNAKTALAFATVFMLCIMLVGGFYVQNIPVWIGWLKYLSFVYYGYNLLLKIEYQDRGFSCEDYYAKFPSAPPGNTYCSVASGNFFPTDVDAPVTLEVCVLFLLLIVLRTGVYLALKQKTTFRKG
mmetsp:Transcript_8214/g.14078  ORF Transcript_8214/g.14078 Transcript_8214/m.14078 type:complete len:703 (-) Transcript_8214:560-2668(-)|eukprot:CAMPEP_0119101640 /NCGR_PEP_ID=MMETSP1180-20130426/634_1 /TAXON_ID=3052 ORGANISM="Chlamydomonas cf sp, Strain CCMP681" /NCGR_SAMPLE_ID=MMETSP1180 /ASSEMBLY_ACC=CAM_ASM_000741 /LENGTH=702 /DNA_ID=CAMNT_0007085791 /DNA_START=29 /DNA_END=2137 /DNA_ORIENTATION=+